MTIEEGKIAIKAKWQNIVLLLVSNIIAIVSIICSAVLLYHDKQLWWLYLILGAISVHTLSAGGK